MSFKNVFGLKHITRSVQKKTSHRIFHPSDFKTRVARKHTYIKAESVLLFLIPARSLHKSKCDPNRVVTLVIFTKYTVSMYRFSCNICVPNN